MKGDGDFEPDETFELRLENVSGAVLGDGIGLGTILNDDIPILSINDVSIVEGNSGTSTLNFTVTRTGHTTSAISVDFATADDTATVADSDYVSNSGTLNFASGITSQTISVTVNGDTVGEADEAFQVVLSNPTPGAEISDDTGIGTIENDDFATFSIADVSLDEGDFGTTAFTFTVTRSVNTLGTNAVDFATADGTANSGSDYTSASGTLSFIPGATTQTFTVNVSGDFEAEDDETFSVMLTNPTNSALIDDGSATGTIQNDDFPTLTINDATIAEGDSGTTTFTFTVSRSIDTTGTTTVDFTTVDGTATAGSDYTGEERNLDVRSHRCHADHHHRCDGRHRSRRR